MNNNYQVDFVPHRRISNADEAYEGSTSILSDSQSLWVLFNPSGGSGGASDILSLSYSDTGCETERDFAEGEDEELDVQRDDAASEDTESNDSLLDTFETAPSQKRLEELFQARSDNLLQSRIDKWCHSADVELEDDNIASWDLDEDLSQQLDTSILKRSRAFYGDDMFLKFTRKQYVEFRRNAKRLKPSLTTKPGQPEIPVLINIILHKIYQDQESFNKAPRDLPNNLRSYSSFLRSNNTQPFLNSMIESQLRNCCFLNNHTPSFSETVSSSSLVLCGPGNGSWDEA